MHSSAHLHQYSFLPEASEAGTIITTRDWSQTSLGAVERWPLTLTQLLGVILRSDAPMVLLWGADGILLYNDAYARFAGPRHPATFGVPVCQAWPEVADFNDHVLATVLAGNTISYRDHHLVLEREGVAEDVWLNLDYSPIPDEDGQPIGVFALLKETTERIRVGQRLRIAQEAGGVGTFEWYPDSGLLDVSDEYRRIWGISSDAIVTDQLLVGLLHPEDRHKAGTAKLDKLNPLEYTEYRRVDPATGTVRWIARRGEAISSSESGRRRYVGIAMDITARKCAEAAVIESEARWRSLFEQMQEGFFVGDSVRNEQGRMVDFTFAELNPAFEIQTGVPLGSALGRRLTDIVPDVSEELIAAYARVVDTGQPYQFESFVPALGNKWFEARARLLSPERFAVMFVDITERKASAKALVENEERFRSLAQSMPNHVWTSKPDGYLDWFNDRVYAYAGAQPGELDGMGWTAMVHPEDIDSAGASWADALQKGLTYESEFRLRGRDGAYRWFIARAEPIRDGIGGIRHWIGTNTDINDQKVAEAALADFAATLEDRVEARTAELNRTQDALRQAQKMEAIGNLTGGVAHDFNNLLQVVSGNLQLLAKDVAGNEKAERRIENAMAGVTRGAKLSGQLLAFGRRQPLAPKVVNVGRLIRGLDEILRRALGEAVEVETIVAGGLWNTLIDPGNVENAVLNLAINARDAMEGRGKLTIEAGNSFLDEAYANSHPEVIAGQYVLLAVTDTGCGMSGDVIEKAFEPFFTTKSEGHGTGLGLSMVYGFVKQSGGHVKVYSEVGHGTTIKLYLPRSARSEDLVINIDDGPVTGGNETILVAEDDEAVRETVVAMLADLGYRVLKAKDAESALAIIESGVSIDLLFTDVVMPGSLKSAELGRKARERLPDLAVLFTSGYTENSIVHGGRLNEGVELLGKPYTRETLARRLRQLLANKAQRLIPPDPFRASPARAPADKLIILLCEDDVLIRMSLVDSLVQLGHAVIEAGDALSALALLDISDVDMLITDVGLPGMTGVELVAQARLKRPSLPAIFATGHNQVEGIELSQSVRILVKPYTDEMLEEAIRQVCTAGEDRVVNVDVVG